MTDSMDPRRPAATEPDQEPGGDEAVPERDLHPVLGAEAAAIGGIAAGFPAGAIADPDLLDDDPAERQHPQASEGDAGEDQGSVPGEGTTQPR